ncbi:hypothetical protein MSG28_015785 [Choristoneura fumiferana]|uniref:Uncharacterized protein n=1 Tax=Choristoneura fumiferana TaxID=7141 RepID=A0ACC0KC87_CHOFU|nr:hypothetical protein MSG28_015785 [Choristoneura fumiferana]
MKVPFLHPLHFADLDEICSRLNLADATERSSRAPSPIPADHIVSNGNNYMAGEPRRKREPPARPNHILLYTIINPAYPITVVSNTP